MTDPVKTPPAAAPVATPPVADKSNEMTVAQAAKAVKRVVVELVTTKDKEGNDVTREVKKREAVEVGEVLAFRDYGTHVVVVTKDGQKLSSAAE